MQRLVREDGIDVCSTSENQGFTALDFANWAHEKGVAGAKDVAAFLAQEIGVGPASLPSTGHSASASTPSVRCSPGVSHPPSKKRRSQRKYWLFEAAGAGCLQCVRHYLVEECLELQSKSDSQGWTALDFAAWARQQGVIEAVEVEEYLTWMTRWADVCPVADALWLEGAHERRPPTVTPPPESPAESAQGIGEQLMLRQGWQPGQGLGRRGQGRRTPVEADTSRSRGQKHGLGFRK